jgi:hypothetical protein
VASHDAWPGRFAAAQHEPNIYGPVPLMRDGGRETFNHHAWGFLDDRRLVSGLSGGTWGLQAQEINS